MKILCICKGEMKTNLQNVIFCLNDEKIAVDWTEESNEACKLIQAHSSVIDPYGLIITDTDYMNSQNKELANLLKGLKNHLIVCRINGNRVNGNKPYGKVDCTANNWEKKLKSLIAKSKYNFTLMDFVAILALCHGENSVADFFDNPEVKAKIKCYDSWFSYEYNSNNNRSGKSSYDKVPNGCNIDKYLFLSIIFSITFGNEVTKDRWNEYVKNVFDNENINRIGIEPIIEYKNLSLSYSTYPEFVAGIIYHFTGEDFQDNMDTFESKDTAFVDAILKNQVYENRKKEFEKKYLTSILGGLSFKRIDKNLSLQSIFEHDKCNDAIRWILKCEDINECRRHIANYWNNANDKVVVYCDVRTLSNCNNDLWEYALGEFGIKAPHFVSLYAHYVKMRLRLLKKKVLFVLDSLESMDANTKQYLDTIVKPGANDLFYGVDIVVLSSGYGSKLKSYEEISVMNLAPNVVKDYLVSKGMDNLDNRIKDFLRRPFIFRLVENRLGIASSLERSNLYSYMYDSLLERISENRDEDGKWLYISFLLPMVLIQFFSDTNRKETVEWKRKDVSEYLGDLLINEDFDLLEYRGNIFADQIVNSVNGKKHMDNYFIPFDGICFRKKGDSAQDKNTYILEEHDYFIGLFLAARGLQIIFSSAMSSQDKIAFLFNLFTILENSKDDYKERREADAFCIVDFFLELHSEKELEEYEKDIDMSDVMLKTYRLMATYYDVSGEKEKQRYYALKALSLYDIDGNKEDKEYLSLVSGTAYQVIKCHKSYEKYKKDNKVTDDGKEAEAFDILVKARDYLETCGADSLELSKAYGNTGAYNQTIKNYAEAKKWHNNSLELKQKIYGLGRKDAAIHLGIFRSLVGLATDDFYIGVNHFSKGEYYEAEIAFKKAIDYHTKAIGWGNDHKVRTVYEAYVRRAGCYIKLFYTDIEQRKGKTGTAFDIEYLLKAIDDLYEAKQLIEELGVPNYEEIKKMYEALNKNMLKQCDGVINTLCANKKEKQKACEIEEYYNEVLVENEEGVRKKLGVI